MKKNLIIGIVKGYDFETIAPFILSLRKTNFKGDLVLFTSGIDKKTNNLLQKYGVKLIPFEKDYHYIKSPNNHKLPKKCSSEMSPNCSRYVMYYLYLLKNKQKYSKIMLADVRDVIFQLNPFDFDFNKKLYFFLEERKMHKKDVIYIQ